MDRIKIAIFLSGTAIALSGVNYIIQRASLNTADASYFDYFEGGGGGIFNSEDYRTSSGISDDVRNRDGLYLYQDSREGIVGGSTKCADSRQKYIYGRGCVSVTIPIGGGGSTNDDDSNTARERDNRTNNPPCDYQCILRGFIPPILLPPITPRVTTTPLPRATYIITPKTTPSPINPISTQLPIYKIPPTTVINTPLPQIAYCISLSKTSCTVATNPLCEWYNNSCQLPN